MTYLAGLQGFGADREPTLRCDECGNEMVVRPRGQSGMPAWLRNGTAPKGWRVTEQGPPRRHQCPQCIKGGSNG